MTARSDIADRALAEHDARPVATEAPADIGDTTDLAETERFEEDRADTAARHEPLLPDRAFDRITPQV